MFHGLTLGNPLSCFLAGNREAQLKSTNFLFTPTFPSLVRLRTEASQPRVIFSEFVAIWYDYVIFCLLYLKLRFSVFYAYIIIITVNIIVNVSIYITIIDVVIIIVHSLLLLSQ